MGIVRTIFLMLKTFLNNRSTIAAERVLETPKGQDGRGTDFNKVNLRKLRHLIHVCAARRSS